MTQTADNVSRHELAGLRVTVTAATNPDAEGISGRVIRETTRTLSIRPDPDGDNPLGDPTARTRQVPKEGATFAFQLPDGDHVAVAGERLLARPARRTETTEGEAWV